MTQQINCESETAPGVALDLLCDEVWHAPPLPYDSLVLQVDGVAERGRVGDEGDDVIDPVQGAQRAQVQVLTVAHVKFEAFGLLNYIAKTLLFFAQQNVPL